MAYCSSIYSSSVILKKKFSKLFSVSFNVSLHCGNCLRHLVFFGIFLRKSGDAFPVSSLGWLLKMVCYSLDPENPTKSCRLRGSNLCVHLRTLRRLPRQLRVCVSEKPPSIWRLSLERSNVCHSVVTVELVGVHRPSSEAGPRVGGPKKVLNFYCTCSKMQTVMLNLRA